MINTKNIFFWPTPDPFLGLGWSCASLSSITRALSADFGSEDLAQESHGRASEVDELQTRLARAAAETRQWPDVQPQGTKQLFSVFFPYMYMYSIYKIYIHVYIMNICIQVCIYTYFKQVYK